MFWKRKDSNFINSREYESIVKKLIEFNERIEEQRILIKNLSNEIDYMRGVMATKMRGKWKKEEETQKPESENINNSVILPYDGKPFKVGY